jgi:hypothetical protein
MKRLGIACATAAVLATLSPSQKAFANHHVAVGLLGGFAAGTLIGAAVASPRYYYYEPVPVQVDPGPPAPMAAGCYWTRGAPVWDGYRGAWIRPRIQVCD